MQKFYIHRSVVGVYPLCRISSHDFPMIFQVLVVTFRPATRPSQATLQVGGRDDPRGRLGRRWLDQLRRVRQAAATHRPFPGPWAKLEDSTENMTNMTRVTQREYYIYYIYYIFNACI